MARFTAKVAVITGAGAGIGKATAIAMAREGARLALFEIREPALEETARVARATGAEVLTFAGDVTRTDDLVVFVARVAQQFGRVDILINNAYASSQFVDFEQETLANLEHSIRAQLFSTFTMMQQCLPLMKEHGGSIVNFSSSAAGGLEGQSVSTAQGRARWLPSPAPPPRSWANTISASTI
jgi:NAD(P)-dependent dehydrogenase (short-subunit alcohol dehydrogenase family)